MTLYCVHWWGAETQTYDESGEHRYHRRCARCHEFWHNKEQPEPKVAVLTDEWPLK